MFVCTKVECMKLLRNDVDNLFNNTHVQIKLFWGFYHGIIYIANEGRHVKIDIWYIHYVWPLPLYYLSFYELRLLTTSFISSNFPS